MSTYPTVVFVIDRNTSDNTKRMWRGYGVQFGDDEYLVVKDHKTKIAYKVVRAQVFSEYQAAARALKGTRIYFVHHDGEIHSALGFVGSDGQFYEFSTWGVIDHSHGFLTRKEALPYARKKARSALAAQLRTVREYERLLAKLQK
jgi:hypothetical protein